MEHFGGKEERLAIKNHLRRLVKNQGEFEMKTFNPSTDRNIHAITSSHVIQSIEEYLANQDIQLQEDCNKLICCPIPCDICLPEDDEPIPPMFEPDDLIEDDPDICLEDFISRLRLRTAVQ